MKKYLICAILFVLLLPLGAAEKKELRMVTSADFPPYEFYQGKKIVGIDADIIREIARRNGFELVIEDMKFDSIIAAIQSGKGDIAALDILIYFFVDFLKRLEIGGGVFVLGYGDMVQRFTAL